MSLVTVYIVRANVPTRGGGFQQNYWQAVTIMSLFRGESLLKDQSGTLLRDQRVVPFLRIRWYTFYLTIALRSRPPMPSRVPVG